MAPDLPSFLSVLSVWMTAGLVSGWLVGLYQSGHRG